MQGQRLFWTNIATGDLVNRDKCQMCAFSEHREHPKDLSPVFDYGPTPKCWTNTVGEVFSASSFSKTHFPKALEDPNRYICVDVKVLHAMIFSVIPDAGLETWSYDAPGNGFDSSVVELEEEEGYVIAHVKGMR